MGILICGLNGSGKSTLGRMLADRIGYEFIDNEDLFFPKTDEVYVFSGPRSKEEAIRLLEEKISKSSKFVFAAVKGDYGEKLIASLDQIVLIDVPKEIRSQRVRERSFSRFGERILPGGDLYDRETAWFSLTDSRPEDYTTKWLETVNCPVIRVDGTLPVEENIGYIMSIILPAGKEKPMDKTERPVTQAVFYSTEDLKTNIYSFDLTGYPDAEPDVNNKEKMKIRKIIGNNYRGHWEKTRTACRGIVVQDGRILLSYETKTGQWMLPGGGLEEGEEEQACCIREVAEETGVLIQPTECQLEIDEYYEGWKWINRYFFGTVIGETEIRLTDREKKVGMEPRWLPLDEIIEIFSGHAAYADTDEMRRGMYLREYTALCELTDHAEHAHLTIRDGLNVYKETII